MTNRSVLVRLRADVSDLVAKSQLAKAAIRSMNDEIDKSNDRTAWLAQGILALTPAVTQLGAGAVPVLSGLATQMTVAVAAAGTMALAFNGVGDALGALNDYQLDPTAENLAQLNEAMAKIGPSGQALVEYLDSLGPVIAEISNSARDGMFPGLISGIRDFMTLAPQLNSIVSEVGEALGTLSGEAGAGLSSARFADFFEYLETQAKPILLDMGRTVGNFFDGFTNMLVAFDPLSQGFSSGLLDMSRSFAQWSAGLEASSGFQEFVSYVREAGPQTLDFLGSLVMMFVELAKAAAPVGAVMLPFLTSLVDLLGDLAATPLGPLAVGFLALTSAWGRLNAVMQITGSGVMSKATSGIRENAKAAKAAVPSFRELGTAMSFAGQGAQFQSDKTKAAMGSVSAFGRSIAPIAGQVGLLALAMSDVDDSLGITNTTSLALAGSLMGPWGFAIGAASGALLDMKSSADGATEGLRGLDEAADAKSIEMLTQRIQQAKDELDDIKNSDGAKDWFGDQMADLFTGGAGQGITDVYTKELEEAEQELADLKNAQADVAADKSLYNSIQAETRALETNIAAMREKRAEAARGLNAELDYKASILDARDALKENGKSVDENTRAGQANLRALYALGPAWNAQTDAIKNAPGALRAARENFINTATAMGMAEDKARRLARQLFEIPTKREIQIKLDADAAAQRARDFQAQIDALRDGYVTIHVSRRSSSPDPNGPFLSGGAGADGLTLPKTGLPYADRFLTLLADGEEVISNRYGQADQFRRDRDNGVIPRYADGGTATKSGDDAEKRRRRMRGGEFVHDNSAQLQAAIDHLALVAQDQTEAVENQTRVVDGAAEETKRWAEKMDSVAKATVAGFDTGLFEKDSNAWAPGAGGGALFNINRDIAGLAERDQLQAQLAGMGITGDALAAMLAQGTNADIAGLIASGQAPAVAAGFQQRAAMQVSVGAAGGQFAYGAQFNAAAAAQATQQANLAVLESVLRATEQQSLMYQQKLDRVNQLLERMDTDFPERTGVAVRKGVDAVAADAARARARGGSN